jgi:hypothetical protein
MPAHSEEGVRGLTKHIDYVFSPDDGGWYAQEYDHARKDNATRVSKKIYRSREVLRIALAKGTHRWEPWS